MPGTLLLLLGQLPQDPASGAARSLRGICELLATQGFDVHAVATTATEHARGLDVKRLLREAGASIEIDRSRAVGRGRPELRFEHRGVRYALLDTGSHGHMDWQAAHGRQFDGMYERVLDSVEPDFVLTFGGSDDDVRRRGIARQRGARVVFGLRNLGYLVPGAFAEVDAVVAPSRFLTERYRAAIGLESTPIPPPIVPEDVIAPERDPIFTTYVNPSPGKGVMLFARLAEELAERRPDIPLLVVESRGTGGNLVGAGLAGGFDLRRHESVMLSAGVPNPRDLFTATRVMLVPSVVEETWGRVAQEAIMNGVPPIVSGRGGLAEACAGAGFVLPLPEDLTVESAKPVAAEAVEPWIELIVRFADDEDHYARCTQRAVEAGEQFRPERLGPRYAAFFQGVTRAERVLA